MYEWNIILQELNYESIDCQNIKSVFWSFINLFNHFQPKMPNFSLYQVLKCADLMFFFVIHHCKLNIFRCFVVWQAKWDSTTLISDKIGQTGIFWGNSQQDQLEKKCNC